jgi:ABC-type sugar transport system permease subunit
LRVRSFAGRRKSASGGRRLALVFVLPAFLIYAVFMLLPFLTSITYSLTDWNGASSQQQFVGLDNYAQLVSDPQLIAAAVHNVIWVIAGTVPPILIGLLLALVIWGGVRFATLWRAVFFVPFVLAPIVVGISWSWIYNPLFGSLNKLLTAVGLGNLTNSWLGDPNTAIWAVLVVSAWVTFGFIMILVIAALEGVDTDLIDASLIDGASWGQRLRSVILPQITPTMTLIGAIMLTYGIGAFDTVFVMTNGGPGTSTELLGTYAYKLAFRRNEVGYGATVALLITVLSFIATAAFVRFRERGRVS